MAKTKTPPKKTRGRPRLNTPKIQTRVEPEKLRRARDSMGVCTDRQLVERGLDLVIEHGPYTATGAAADDS